MLPATSCPHPGFAWTSSTRHCCCMGCQHFLKSTHCLHSHSSAGGGEGITSATTELEKLVEDKCVRLLTRLQHLATTLLSEQKLAFFFLGFTLFTPPLHSAQNVLCTSFEIPVAPLTLSLSGRQARYMMMLPTALFLFVLKILNRLFKVASQSFGRYRTSGIKWHFCMALAHSFPPPDPSCGARNRTDP